jgi:hypothetical protein
VENGEGRWRTVKDVPLSASAFCHPHAMETGRTMKDVSPHEFVKAYAAHLKRSGKVLIFFFI